MDYEHIFFSSHNSARYISAPLKWERIKKWKSGSMEWKTLVTITIHSIMQIGNLKLIFDS